MSLFNLRNLLKNRDFETSEHGFFSSAMTCLAPNPAKDYTTIFYSFVNKNSAKKLVMVDMLGRILQQWMPTESTGEIKVDCSHYANGQYLILMKEDDKVIENTKLITN